MEQKKSGYSYPSMHDSNSIHVCDRGLCFFFSHLLYSCCIPVRCSGVCFQGFLSLADSIDGVCNSMNETLILWDCPWCQNPAVCCVDPDVSWIFFNLSATIILSAEIKDRSNHSNLSSALLSDLHFNFSVQILITLFIIIFLMTHITCDRDQRQIR